MSAGDLPSVSMLRAFRVDGESVNSGCLSYDNLDNEAKLASLSEAVLFGESCDSEPGSIEEESKARRAALGYLVLTAAQLQSVPPIHQPAISERFTQSSIELYGEPDPNEAQMLIAQQLDNYHNMVGSEDIDQNHLSNLISTLSSAQVASAVAEHSEPEERYKNVAETYKNALYERYGSVFAIFKDVVTPSQSISNEDVKKLFQAGLDLFASSDNRWKNWRVEIESGSNMSTKANDKLVSIGDRGTYRPERLLPLFAHEVLVHGLRSVNSEGRDELLNRGLPGNLEAEEGLAIFTEYSLTGVVPDRIVDRYIDTSLALGQTAIPAMKRSDLHMLHVSRLFIREQTKNPKPELDRISEAAWNHVNRIYRGSLGNHIVGVNTKDTVYYAGFAKIADFIAKSIADGQDVLQVFDYIMQGKFDPTNTRHVEYVQSLPSS